MDFCEEPSTSKVKLQTGHANPAKKPPAFRESPSDLFPIFARLSI